MSGVETAQLEAVADKNKGVAFALAIFLPPLAYLYVGKKKWAIFNLLTLNYLLFGILIVPFHTYSTIMSAREAVQGVVREI